MEEFGLKLDTATGTIAVADPLHAALLPAPDPSRVRRPRSAGAPRSRRRESSRAATAQAGALLGQQAAAALLAGHSPEQYETTLRLPIKNGKTKSTRRLGKSMSRSESRSARGSSRNVKAGRKSKKKKSIKRLAQQRELDMYRCQLRTEREKFTRELDNFRQKTNFLRYRHQTSSDDKERELRDTRVKCRLLEDELASVTEELELTKQHLDVETRCTREYRGEDFRDANSARLSELEETARHLLFTVAEERRLRLHCAQCDIPLVSIHTDEENSAGDPSAQKVSRTDYRTSSSKSAATREDEQLVVFYPCRHARFCTKCARNMERCKVCSREIRSKVLLINSKLR